VGDWTEEVIDLSSHAGDDVKLDLTLIVGTAKIDAVGLTAHQCIRVSEIRGDGIAPTGVGDPVDFASGSLTHQHTDLAIPGLGIPIEFTRSYSTSGGDDLGLGERWTHTYSARLDVQSDNDVFAYRANGSVTIFDVRASLTETTTRRT
jgi:hypothetical protein